MGEANIAKHIHMWFKAAGDNLVSLADMTKAESPVYADKIRGKEVFYVGVANAIRVLSGSEMVSCVVAQT